MIPLCLLLALVQAPERPVVGSVGAAVEPDVRQVAGCPEYVGQAVARYGDWDGDGRSDFLISAPRGWGAEADGTPGAGRVFLVSGKTGKVLLSVRGNGVWFGTGLRTLGDLNRDGVAEFAIGRLHAPAVVISGRDAAVLRQVGAAPRRGGDVVWPVGDIDGDGVPDLAWPDQASLRFESGATGVQLHAELAIEVLDLVRLPGLDVHDRPRFAIACVLRDPPCVAIEIHALGKAGLARIQRRILGDSAGKRDVRLSVSPAGGSLLAIGCRSGAADWSVGSVGLKDLDDLRDPAWLSHPHAWRSFGHSVDLGGDVDGDGVADVLVTQPASIFDNGWGGACIFSGAKQTLLRSHTGDPFVGDPFTEARWVGDTDGDGVEDYVLSSATEAPDAAPSGIAELRSGATGELLFKFPDAWKAQPAAAKPK